MKFLLQDIYCNRYMAVDKRRNIFDFNHIDTALSQGTIEMLKNFYAYYPKKHYGYEKLTTAFKEKTCFNLQYCGGQSCLNLSGCRGCHFEPHSFRFFYWVRPRRKSGGQLQKLWQKNRESQLCQGRVQENS